MNVKSPSTKQTSIDDARGEINQVDQQIVELLAQRRNLTKSIATLKNESGAALRDQSREVEVLVDRIRSGKALGLDSHLVTRIFHEIIEDSNRLQREQLQTHLNGSQTGILERVAFHGIEGSYSYFAARKYFARSQNDTAYLTLYMFIV
jgi:chorismate mutase/prephenate dehydratase